MGDRESTEDLSLIAADDQVTCAIYAKKHDLLHLDGWKRLRNTAKKQKTLTRAINQNKSDKLEDQLFTNLDSSSQETTKIPLN